MTLTGRTVCLCMIVKDEASVIGRCLDSVRGLVDGWVVCDTGSGDDTRELIAGALAGVPGELHERPWVSFGHNRSELLALAHGRADLLLLIDADMTVERTGALPAELPDACLLRIPSPELDYRMPLLVSGRVRWRSEGVTHEYLTSDEPHTRAPIDALVVHHHLDGGTRPEKFERDLALLLGDWEREQSPRTAFYIAQTLRDLGRWAEALPWYERRVALGGWEEELFYARMQVGIGHAELGDWPRGLAELIGAWESRPQRLEPLYEIVSRLRLRGEYHAALALAERGLGREPPEDILFVAPWVYRFGMLFEYSICAYWCESPGQALRACDELLARDDLPDAHRRQTQVNRGHCLKAVAEQAVRRSATEPPRWAAPGSRSR